METVNSTPVYTIVEATLLGVTRWWILRASDDATGDAIVLFGSDSLHDAVLEVCWLLRHPRAYSSARTGA